MKRNGAIVPLLAALSFVAASSVAAPANVPGRGTLLQTFIELSDLACQELPREEALNKSGELSPAYYQDSYTVRALNVTYDLTGEEKYLKACQDWTDKMVKAQAGVTPAGGYDMYLNYYRKPGAAIGQWYVADTSSIAMGVLATAVRTGDAGLRSKYVQSVRAYADLVIGAYSKDGGIVNGLWEKYRGPWYCSTGLFGSVAFLLHKETGEKRYLDAGLKAIDWLNAQDIEQAPAGPPKYALKEMGPAFVMYFFESYSAGLPYLTAGTERYRKALMQIDLARKWMPAHLNGLGGVNQLGYNSQWGSKAGGLPFHLLIWSQSYPASHPMVQQADAELAYISSIAFDPDRFKQDKRHLSQLMTFTMFSMAERLSPGSVYRR